jgi:hypothetical protein
MIMFTDRIATVRVNRFRVMIHEDPEKSVEPESVMMIAVDDLSDSDVIIIPHPLLKEFLPIRLISLIP